MKRVTLTNGVCSWSGRTRKEAEAERDTDLNRLFADYEKPPVLVVRRGVVRAIAWQGFDGFYSYSMVWPTDAKLGCTTSGQYTREEAEIKMRRHLAQIIYDEEGADASLTVIKDGDEEGMSQHKSWLRFQAEWKAANAA